jgi:hypothetical protein
MSDLLKDFALSSGEIETIAAKKAAAREAAQAKTPQAQKRKKKERPNRMDFLPLDLDLLETLAIQNKIVWALIVVRLDELWWTGSKCGPVKLAAFTRGGIHVTKNKKARGLAISERAGWVSVERQFKKSPLVTIEWRKPKVGT